MQSFRIDSPYPEPKNLPENLRYARLLQDNFSGRCSELTSVCQYIYHHFAAEADHPDLATRWRGIAVVEMHHLDLLGGCIRQFGVEPKYQLGGRQPMWWNASLVKYGRTVRDRIDTDIEGEYEAIDGYMRTMERIDEDQVRALITRIIEDEKLHIQILETMRKEI